MFGWGRKARQGSVERPRHRNSEIPCRNSILEHHHLRLFLCVLASSIGSDATIATAIVVSASIVFRVNSTYKAYELYPTPASLPAHRGVLMKAAHFLNETLRLSGTQLPTLALHVIIPRPNTLRILESVNTSLRDVLHAREVGIATEERIGTAIFEDPTRQKEQGFCEQFSKEQ